MEAGSGRNHIMPWGKTRFTLAGVLAAALAVPGGASAAQAAAGGVRDADCRGARAMERSCLPARHTASVYPTATEGPGALWRAIYDPATVCRGGLFDSGGLDACRLGVDPAGARRQVAIIGDSHSAHWRPGVDFVARKRGWSVVSIYVSGCDFTALARYRGNNPPRCREMRSAVPGWLAANPSIDTVIFSQVSRQGPDERQGYLRAWAGMPQTVKNVVVISDNPHAGGPAVLNCIEAAQRKGRLPGVACAKPRRAVLHEDAALQAARSGPAGGRSWFPVDVSDRFCDDRRCYPVIGGLLVYGWLQHQAPAFNRSLGPYLDARLPSGL